MRRDPPDPWQALRKNRRLIRQLLNLATVRFARSWRQPEFPRRWFVAGLALLAFGVCVGVFWSQVRSTPRVTQSVSGEATIEFLDVGQGDAALITSPEGKRALIDAGPSNRVVELLRDRGVDQLDLVVVSHHHIDHYGGMRAVIRQFHPRVFLDADSPHVTPSYLALISQVKDEGLTAIRAGPVERTIELGSITLTVFAQAPEDSKDENNNSVGIRLQYGGFSALFSGDAEGPERRWWIGHETGLCEGVDVLKLAHHGSRNGTDRAWLRLTRPKLAVASLASGNEFGHPHPETLALLKSMAIPIERTDQAGTILIRTDGSQWSVETERPSGVGARNGATHSRSGSIVRKMVDSRKVSSDSKVQAGDVDGGTASSSCRAGRVPAGFLAR